MIIIISILLFYFNGNHDMTLNILYGGFESIKLIAFTDRPYLLSIYSHLQSTLRLLLSRTYRLFRYI